MSEVFYRKWRPRRLDQVVGQDPVTQTLRRAVLLDRVAHAYLFCGPRGTGKTSTARILAKAVNCRSPQDGEPDNCCDICLSFNEGRALDLLEIDGASNRGIDDIRNLRERIQFVPNETRYKVYIIDEVHMLTTEAFNALLKTLEEPPEHAILVLATTEIHRVPLTVISRCQRFDFRRIPLEVIVSKLAQLCTSEGIDASPEALNLIARQATGSLRDAENLLEQAVVSYGSPVTEERLRDILELGGDEVGLELVDTIVNRRVRDGFVAIDQVSGQGGDLRQLHRAVMEYLRGILLLKAGAPAPPGLPKDTLARLKSLASTASMDQLVRTLKTFSNVDLRRDSTSPLPLELALVESSTDSPIRKAADTRSAPAFDAASRQRPSAAQTSSADGPTRTSPRDAATASPRRAVGARSGTESNEVRAAPSGDAARLESQWDSVVRSLRYVGTRFKLGALLRGCRERDVEDGVVKLRFPYRSHVERMEQELGDPGIRREMESVLAQVMGKPHKVQVLLTASKENGPRHSAAQTSNLVRAAQAMGMQVVGEKEEETGDEQEDAPPSPAAPAGHDEASGGA